MSALFRNTLLLGVLLLLVGWPVAMLGEAAYRSGDAEPARTVEYDRGALGSNTVVLVAVTLVIALPIATATALLVFRSDMPARTPCGVLLITALMVPLDLQASAWLAALGPGGLAATLGIPLELRGLGGAVWVHAAAAVPWVFVLAGAATRAVEPELEEDCLLVAGGLGTVWHVTLRRSAGSLAAAALLVGVLSAGEMAVTDLLGVRTYAETVYTEFAVAGRISAATATAVPGFLVLLAILGLASMLVARGVPADIQALLARRPVFRLGRWRVPALLGAMLVVAMTLGVPAVSLLWRAGLTFPRRSFSTGASATAAAAGGQMTGTREFGGGPQWSAATVGANLVRSIEATREELLYSLGLAAACAGLVVPLALACALAARKSGFGRTLAVGVMIVLLALPGPVLGAGVSLALNRPTAWWGAGSGSLGARVADGLAAVADSPVVLIWVMSLRTLPFALLVLWPAVRLIDRSLLEASQIDGAAPWQQLRHIVLPACWPAVHAAALVSAVLSLGELGATVIVAPPGLQPLSVRIFTLAHSGVESYLAGICLVLLMVTALGALATWCCFRWVGRRAVGSPATRTNELPSS